MTITKVSAYHEAAHALIAHRSQFHKLIGRIDLRLYGSGETFISLSKSKLEAVGKSATTNSQKDKDVVKDLAVILVAGFVAEQIAAESDNAINPNIDCAVPDHELLRSKLAAAGLSKHFNYYEEQARAKLKAEWHLVEKVANFLYKHGGSDVDDIIVLMD